MRHPSPKLLKIPLHSSFKPNVSGSQCTQSPYLCHISVTNRKRRALSNYFYVEILRTISLGTQRQSLLIIAALDARNAFSPLPASEACRILGNSVRQCVESCDVLQLARLPCQGGLNTNIGNPSVDESASSLGSGGIAGIAVVVIILLIAILFGAVFYYRRKYKKAKVNRS